MSTKSLSVTITPANTALILLFGSACFHSISKYFYYNYRLVFGTLYPAYSSYKAVKNRDVREYSRWMMYWIVFAIFSFVEVFADIFIGFWLPFYYESKILLIVWLISPYGNGSKILYLHLIHPQLTTHEQQIDLYIDSAKQMGITSVWHLRSKVTDFANKTLICLVQIVQTVALNQMQRTTSAVDGPPVQPIQTQQLLSQPNFLQQLLFMRSPKPGETNSPDAPQPVQTSLSENANISINPISQRWFSEEVLNITEITDEFKPMQHSMSVRMRSESESNLDDWEQMDVNEVDAKPPQHPTKGRKKPKSKATVSGERPVRRTPRAAALKARAKCKEEDSFPEEY